MKIDTGKNAISEIKHGWCCNSEGVPLIWMPLLQWVQDGSNAYERPKALLKQWKNFAYALRKVSEYRRVCIQSAADLETNFKEFQETICLLPSIVEYAFGISKRIVSSTIDVLKFRGAFKNDGSISDKTRKFLGQIDNIHLSTGNSQQFIEAWKKAEEWYWELADPTNVSEDSEKGIRDLLEHRNVIMQVNVGATDDNWYCDLSIHNKKGEIIKNWVLEYMTKVVAGLCLLYDGIYASLQLKDCQRDEQGYHWVLPHGKLLCIVGRFEDYIAFWPSFGKNNTITTEYTRITFQL